MIMLFTMILLFVVRSFADGYICDKTTNIHSTNAEGTLSSKWELVEGNTIKYVPDINLQATSINGVEFYYKQSLVDEEGRNNYTAITKVDGELNVLWEKVYKTGLHRSEKIVLDNLGYFYTILNIGDSQNNYDIIVKHNQAHGEFVESIKLNKTENFRLRNLQLDASNHNISFMMTGNTPKLSQVCYFDADNFDSITKCYYRTDLNNVTFSYHFNNIFVLSLMLNDYQFFLVFMDLFHNSEFHVKINTFPSIIRMENATDKDDYFIIEKDFFHSMLIHRAKISSNFWVNSTNQITLEVGTIEDINVVYNTKRSTCYIFVIYQKIPKIIMVQIKRDNTIKSFAFRSSTNKPYFGTVDNRWIYFAESTTKLDIYNNIIRIYDQAIQQNDLIYELNLSIIKGKITIANVEYLTIESNTTNSIVSNSTENLVSNFNQTKEPNFENIALDLEYQYFEKNEPTVSWNKESYDQSCLKYNENIKFFVDNHDSGWVEFDTIDHEITIKDSSDIISTFHEFRITAKYQEKEYNKPISIQVIKCNITNCRQCYLYDFTNFCSECISGYRTNSNFTSCIPPDYHSGYAKSLYILLIIVSTSTTFFFFILFMAKSNLSTHMIIYIENKILLIYLLSFYKYKIPKELHYIQENQEMSPYFSIYLPFAPIFSMLLYLFSSFTGYNPNIYDTEEHALLLSLIVTISVSYILVLLLLHKIFCRSSAYIHEHSMTIKHLLLMMSWYMFVSSICYPKNLAIIEYIRVGLIKWSYFGTFAFIQLPWMLFLLYLLIKFLPDILIQIALGETFYGRFGTSFMDRTKTNIASRFLLFAWFIRMLLSQILQPIIWESSYCRYDEEISGIYEYDNNFCYMIQASFDCILWLFILIILRPFREDSANFASILNLCVISLFQTLLAVKSQRFLATLYDDFAVTLLILAASLPGTFLMISYRFIFLVINLIIQVFPYVKWFFRKTYRMLKSFLKDPSCKRKRAPRNFMKNTNQQVIQNNKISQLNSSSVANHFHAKNS